MQSMVRLFSTRQRIAVAVLLTASLAGHQRAAGCPFCSAVSLTFAQEIAQSEAAVIGRLREPPPPGSLSPRADGPLPKGTFDVIEVLKGGDAVSAAGLLGADARPLETIMLEDKPAGSRYLLMAVEPPELVWSSPIPVSERAIDYLRRLGSLPDKGPERLAFFMQHLEDDDETLARDAYDEFAVSPYEDVRGLRDRMDADRLMGWIEDPKVQANRRRLYATMLGVCGTGEHAERIGRILEGRGLPAGQAEVRNGLDALIACYVTLVGNDGLELVDRLFLDRDGEQRDGERRDVPFAETYAAVMALRFLGEESEIVPRQRVLESLRLLLDEPKLADLVVADLARWEDWSVVDRLTGIFKDAQADNIFVREPIVNYLRACPLPEAVEALRELEAIDPEAVRRAATLAGLAGLTSTASPSGDPAGSDAAHGVPPVLTDEDGSGQTSTAFSAEGAGGTLPSDGTSVGSGWKFALWAAVVLLVAIVSRLLLRPAGRTEPPAR
jgi:hypothetical protein